MRYLNNILLFCTLLTVHGYYALCDEKTVLILKLSKSLHTGYTVCKVLQKTF